MFLPAERFGHPDDVASRLVVCVLPVGPSGSTGVPPSELVWFLLHQINSSGMGRRDLSPMRVSIALLAMQPWSALIDWCDEYGVLDDGWGFAWFLYGVTGGSSGMLCHRYITVYAVMGSLVAQRECVARDHLGHRPPGVGRVFSKFVLGSSDGKGGSA